MKKSDKMRKLMAELEKGPKSKKKSKKKPAKKKPAKKKPSLLKKIVKKIKD